MLCYPWVFKLSMGKGRDRIADEDEDGNGDGDDGEEIGNTSDTLRSGSVNPIN